MSMLNYYTPNILANMSDDEVKTAAKTHGFELVELKNTGKIDHERYRRLTHVSADEHYLNLIHRYGDSEILAKYTDSYIKEIITAGDISELELKSRGILKKDDIDRIMGRPLEPVRAESFKGLEEILAELPKLAEDRVDLFILGVAGSGKTSFLSGVLKGAKDTGNLDLPMMLDEQGNATNRFGIMYANHLISTVERNLPANRNPFEFLTYMAVNFRDNKQQVHPMSFMEMSGELFEDCYCKNRSELSPKLQNYLFHDNYKMLFCVIDYHVHSDQRTLDVQQWMHFEWFLQLLDANGTLGKCLVISILITKWDLSFDQSPESAKAFLQKEYMNLYNSCQRYAEKYNLKFQIITFSLGHFDARNAVTYNPKDSTKVINWLCEQTPIARDQKKKGWFNF